VLIRQLALEMPDIAFTLADGPRVNVIWVCGYEAGAAELVTRLRRMHPSATLVVSGRPPLWLWAPEVLAAGVDHACLWPLDYARLSHALHQAHA